MSSTLKILSLLEAYEARQQEAQASWKKAQWNMTKAKQQKGADAVTVDNVREELRSRCVLVVEEDVPNLVDDDGQKSKASRAAPVYRLVDPVEHEQREKENSATTVSTPKDGGLRNRKSKQESDNAAEKKWEVTEDSEFMDEETKLRSVDSIELFGLPTKDLRHAKLEAHRAVSLYVEAANLLLVLQEEMRKHKK